MTLKQTGEEPSPAVASAPRNRFGSGLQTIPIAAVVAEPMPRSPKRCHRVKRIFTKKCSLRKGNYAIANRIQEATNCSVRLTKYHQMKTCSHTVGFTILAQNTEATLGQAAGWLQFLENTIVEKFYNAARYADRNLNQRNDVDSKVCNKGHGVADIRRTLTTVQLLLSHTREVRNVSSDELSKA